MPRASAQSTGLAVLIVCVRLTNLHKDAVVHASPLRQMPYGAETLKVRTVLYMVMHSVPTIRE